MWRTRYEKNAFHGKVEMSRTTGFPSLLQTHKEDKVELIRQDNPTILVVIQV